MGRDRTSRRPFRAADSSRSSTPEGSARQYTRVLARLLKRGRAFASAIGDENRAFRKQRRNALGSPARNIA